MFMLHKLVVCFYWVEAELLRKAFLTQLCFSNDFIDHLTKCTIRYTTQAEAWQTEPQWNGLRPSTDTQKPSQIFFLKVRKLVRPPQCHLIKYYLLTCYEHIDPLLFYIFFCQWLDNFAIASEIKERNLNTDDYLATCPQVKRMKKTTTVSTNRMEPIFKGHTTNEQKKRITSAWISTFLDTQHLQ